MDRKCISSLPSKVNGKCAYDGKFQSKCLIYEVTCSLYEAIYIGNTQQSFKKIRDGHFYDLQRQLKNEQKLDSFAAYLVQHFNNTTLRMYLRKFVTFTSIKEINLIGAMKTFTKPNRNLCIQERLMILKIYVTNPSWL